MPRRKESVADLFILLPWWVSAFFAVVSFFALPAIAASLPTAPMHYAALKGLLTGGKVIIPFAFCLLALISAFRSWRVKSTLAAQSGLDSLREVPWKEFEDLMGGVFRRQGYSVAENLGGGADGGVDLILRRAGQTTLVQCKRWKGKMVGVNIVRELFGVMTADGAESGILVTTSGFTSEASQWARGKKIRLIDGGELTTLVKSVQSGRAYSPAEPALPGVCPRCGSALVVRTASKGQNAGNRFMGCSSFPKCRHTQPV